MSLPLCRVVIAIQRDDLVEQIYVAKQQCAFKSENGICE